MEKKIRKIRINDDVWGKIKLMSSLYCMTVNDVIEQAINEAFLKNKDELESKTQIEIKQKIDNITEDTNLTLLFLRYEKAKPHRRQAFEYWIGEFNKFKYKPLLPEQKEKLDKVINELIEKYKNANE